MARNSATAKLLKEARSSRPKSGEYHVKSNVAMLPSFYENGGYPESLGAAKKASDPETLIAKLREENATLKADVEILRLEMNARY